MFARLNHKMVGNRRKQKNHLLGRDNDDDEEDDDDSRPGGFLIPAMSDGDAAAAAETGAAVYVVGDGCEMLVPARRRLSADGVDTTPANSSPSSRWKLAVDNSGCERRHTRRSRRRRRVWTRLKMLICQTTPPPPTDAVVRALRCGLMARPVPKFSPAFNFSCDISQRNRCIRADEADMLFQWLYTDHCTMTDTCRFVEFGRIPLTAFHHWTKPLSVMLSCQNILCFLLQYIFVMWPHYRGFPQAPDEFNSQIMDPPWMSFDIHRRLSSTTTNFRKCF